MLKEYFKDIEKLSIYTDGSCNTKSGNGAWAVIILHCDNKIVLSGTANNTTNNRMELHAVIEAIMYCVKFHKDSELKIFSDSQFVCNLLSRKEKLLKTNFVTKKGNKLNNYDLIEKFYQLANNNLVEIIKIKAHQKPNDENVYNIEVDKLSRKLVRQLKNS